MSNKFAKTLGVAGLVVGVAALFAVMLFVNAVVNAWVFSQLWQWYVVDFFQQPQLPMAVAFGISLMFSALRGMKIPKKEDYNVDVGASLVGLIVFPLIILIMGYVGTWFL